MFQIEFTGPDGFCRQITSIKMYSDSTTMVKTPYFDEIVRNADTVTIQASNLSTFVAALSVVDGVRTMDEYAIKRLVLPYIPGARQDRPNPTGDVGFMLKTVATIINAYDFEEVVVVDPHSTKAGWLIENMVEFPLVDIYEHLPKIYDAVIAPDKGARLRATIAGGVLAVPVVTATKHRDESTGKLSGFGVDVEAGKHYIVIDDICDGGGTFVGLGEKIKEQGATADLYVTHPIFSKGTDELKKFYGTVYTTNTRSVDLRNDVTTIGIMKELRNN